MTKSFEKWFKSTFKDLHKKVEGGDHIARNHKKALWLGYKSRQAEVDELFSAGNNLLDRIQELCRERDELQKQIDDLEQNKRCAQNLVNDLSIAKSKLNQIAIQAQKELDTFGSALRFKDAVQDILELKND